MHKERFAAPTVLDLQAAGVVFLIEILVAWMVWIHAFSAAVALHGVHDQRMNLLNLLGVKVQ